MSNATTISVVLPTHNGSRYLDQAIQSIVGQSFADWQLIIVDDASTDETPAKIEAWARRERRIEPLHLPQQRLLPGALNDGFQRAKGTFLTWTSDDNRYGPQAFARMLEVLQSRSDIDLVYAASTEIDAADAPIGQQPARPPEALAVGNCVGGCFLYRRQVHEALGGFDESLFLAEDYDFWLRTYLQFTLYPLDETLYFYRKHKRSLSEQRSRAVSLAAERAVQAWLRNESKSEKRLPRNIRGRALEALGQRALIRGDVNEGRRFLWQAMRLLRRPPQFRQCRSYLVDFLLGRHAGSFVRAAARRIGR